MSLLDELAERLTSASDTLPLSSLRRAVGDMNQAADRLRYAVALGGPSVPLSRVASATAHLESGVGLLLRAQDEVAGYLGAIGASSSHLPSSAAVSGSAASPASAGACWWARRVGELTGVSPVPASASFSPDDLLARVSSWVALGDRQGLADGLVAAGPGIGLGLSRAASARLPGLMAAWLGRAAGPGDVEALRSRVSFGGVLPGLPAGVAAAVVARACAFDEPGGDDPAGVAVGTAVLVVQVAAWAGRPVGGRAGHTDAPGLGGQPGRAGHTDAPAAASAEQVSARA